MSICKEQFLPNNNLLALQSFDILLDNSRDIILFTDHRNKIIEASTSATKAYGYSRLDLLQMSLHDIWEDGPSYLAGCNFQGFTISFHRKKDGDVFPVEVLSQRSTSDSSFCIHLIRNITEKKLLEKNLDYIMNHDVLTKIPNRFHLEKFLKLKVQGCEEGRQCGIFMLLDLDNFRLINDTFGYKMGDQILISFVQTIQKLIGPNDLFARLGEDEFGIYLEGLDNDEGKALANQLRKALEDSELCVIDLKDFCINVTASIGMVPIDGQLDEHKLLSYAHIALDAAKQGGKNRVVLISNDFNKTKLVDNVKMVNLIKNNLRDNGFFLYYQPVFDKKGTIVHYESLIRMGDYDGTIVYPGMFISLAEHFGLMSQIDYWVINEALNTLKKYNGISIFVNISGASLGSDSLLEDVERAILDSGVEPSRLGFEITETTAIKDLNNALDWINRLKKIGCTFALDDFGTGFSSFGYLNKIPIDYIKIDGSFIKDLDKDPSKGPIIKAITSIANAYGIKTIAEYVERREILLSLEGLNVDFFQGYYLGIPLPDPK